MATCLRKWHALALSCLLHSIQELAVEGGRMSLRKSTIQDSPVDANSFREELAQVSGAVIGCGRPAENERLLSTRSRLLPMWEALPKNSHGCVERRALRYLCHRYFMRHFGGIFLRGLEPAPTTNSSNSSMIDSLSEHVPMYLEALVKDSKPYGICLAKAVHMIVILEQLISDSQIPLLEHIYGSLNLSTSLTFQYAQAKEVVVSYLAHWQIGFSFFNQAQINAPIPLSWSDYAEGQIQSLSFRRQQSPKRGRSKEAWSMQYSFEDSLEIVTSTTNSLGSFFVQGWCSSMKEALVGMDPRGMGRVPLSKFYGDAVRRKKAKQVMRFTESEDYLRELGALDESSVLRGKQVIIPNYLQSAANCQISKSHYLLCCANECEDILDEIESDLKAPVAAASKVLAVIGNLTIQVTLEDDKPFQLGYGLDAQLHRMASENGGQVHLHGRLFAQWLHFAFPRECPFPYETGKAMITPDEFGLQAHASLFRMHKVANDMVEAFAMETFRNSSKEELEWMSQWDWQEKHFVETALELGVSTAKSRKRSFYVLGAACALLTGVVCASGFSKDGAIAAHYV